MIKKKDIIKKLQTCFDPEIPIDLWNLGLIYEINITNNSKPDIEILMTLTTPGCTMINVIAQDVKTKIESLDNIGKVNVNVTFEPPWDPNMMTDKGKEMLGFSKPKTTKKNEEWE